MIFICSLIISCIIYIHFYRVTRDALNPFGVSIAIYLTLYGVSTLNLSIYQEGMRIYTHFLIILPVVIIFIIGEYYCINNRKMLIVHNDIPVVTRSYRIFVLVICVVSFMAVVYLLLTRNIDTIIDLSLDGALNDRKEEIGQRMFGLSGVIGKIAQLFPYTSIFVIYDFIFSKNKTIIKILIELAYCFGCGYYCLFVIVSRGTLLCPILATLFLLNKKYQFKIRTIVIVLLVVVVLFTSYMSLRVVAHSEVFSGTIVDNRLFNSIYNYFALAFNNFDLLVRNGTPYTIVEYSMNSLSKLLGVYNSQDLLQFETSFFNSKIFIYGFYHDLGVLGIVLWTSIIYFFIGKIYILSRHRYPELILMVSMYGKALFVLSFGNYFFQSLSDEIQYYVCAILLVIGYGIVRNYNKRLAY